MYNSFSRLSSIESDSFSLSFFIWILGDKPPGDNSPQRQPPTENTPRDNLPVTTRRPDPNRPTTWGSEPNPNHNPNRPTGWGFI